MDAESTGRAAVEARFARVFAHLGLITAYARRRGAHDAEEIAAEAMAIAWRRLADVPHDDPRPWLIATARNLLLAERRRHGPGMQDLEGVEVTAAQELSPPAIELDAELESAVGALSAQDREALLLVAWEDLTPAAAAASLGISASAFGFACTARGGAWSTSSRRARSAGGSKTANPAWSSYEARSTSRAHPGGRSGAG